MKKASVFAPSTQIQIFSKPHSFYPASCCRGLKPPWRAVSKRCALRGGFTGFVSSLHSYISTLNTGEISSNYWEKFILAFSTQNTFLLQSFLSSRFRMSTTTVCKLAKSLTINQKTKSLTWVKNRHHFCCRRIHDPYRTYFLSQKTTKTEAIQGRSLQMFGLITL